MSERKLLDLIEKLEDKFKKLPNIPRMNINNINNINNNFQNFNNINDSINTINNSNNRFNLNVSNKIDENYIRQIIKEELPGLIYQYQKDLSNRLSYLESKIDSINRKRNNPQINSNNIEGRNSLDQGNKIAELEYKISEIESFFKLWKGIIKDSDDNILNSRMKMNNDQELKLKQLDNKVSNELKQFNDIINKEINDIKNSMKQIKYDNGIEMNKLEEEIKKIKVDFNYLGQDLDNIKTFFKNEVKNELDNIKQNNNNFIKDFYLLKEDFENTQKSLKKIIKIGNDSMKGSDICFIEQVNNNNNNNNE